MLGVDLQAHRVNYNDNPVLKWCLTNTGIQTDKYSCIPVFFLMPRDYYLLSPFSSSSSIG